MKCPRCGGEMIVVGRRAWCAKQYADGGCGSFYVEKQGQWIRDAAISAPIGPGMGW